MSGRWSVSVSHPVLSAVRKRVLRIQAEGVNSSNSAAASTSENSRSDMRKQRLGVTPVLGRPRCGGFWGGTSFSRAASDISMIVILHNYKPAEAKPNYRRSVVTLKRRIFFGQQMGASYREVGYLTHSVPGAPLFLLRVRRVFSIWFTSRGRRGSQALPVGTPTPPRLPSSPYSNLPLRRKVFFADNLCAVFLCSRFVLFFLGNVLTRGI